MPIYEYECEDCRIEFEELVLGSASEPEVCPKCGSDKIGRLVSTFGLAGTSGGGSGSSCSGCTAKSCGGCSG
jgi:putative FmdB family regulatory protein